MKVMQICSRNGVFRIHLKQVPPTAHATTSKKVEKLSGKGSKQNLKEETQEKNSIPNYRAASHADLVVDKISYKYKTSNIKQKKYFLRKFNYYDRETGPFHPFYNKLRSPRVLHCKISSVFSVENLRKFGNV